MATRARNELRRRRRSIGLAAALVSLTAVLVFAFAASTAPLPGSNFEIDDGNLVVNGGPLALDWANVAENRKADAPSGPLDDSFGNGTKEDTPVPTIVNGSIPPNKSDLLHFGVYLETNAAGRFLNLFWRRVQEPSGTTNMDFEFNKSSQLSANGVTPVRTNGDVLIQYDLARGGTSPTLFASRWIDGSTGETAADCQANNALPCWKTKVDLTAAGVATGSINTAAIPDNESDGLGPMSARTFGEAQVDLTALSGGPGHCAIFGSAYLKSRSSASFTAELKDFIAPETVDINQCGTVIIRKVTDPVSDPASVQFGYTKSFNTDPATPNTFTLGHGQNKSYIDTVPQGTGYTVVEDTLPQGWDFLHVDCSASSGVTVDTTAAPQISFNIDDPNDVVDCTYTNRSRGTVIIKKITDDGQGAFDFTSNTLSPAAWTLTTTGPGEAGSASRTFADLVPGTYDAAETVPAGWNLVGTPSCTDGSPVSAISLQGGETVTCTFHDARERGNIIVRKITDDGQGTFHYTSSTLDPNAFDLTTTGPGAGGADQRAYNGILASSLAGPYDVAETVPAGWNLVSATCDDGSPVSAIDLQDGETVTCTFHDARERGNIIVRKVTDDGQGTFSYTSNTLVPAAFDLTTTGPGDPGADSRPFNGILASSLVGPYDVAETIPVGWNLVSATCDDGSPVSAIDLQDGETVTCTFHDARERGNLIVRKITDDGQGTFSYTSNTLVPAAFDLTTTGPGAGGADQRAYNGILASSLAGPYDVAETVPAGWNLVSATCDDGSPVSAIDVGDGETVTCTFHNARQRGAIDILKLRKHAADGPGDHPHAGVTFTVEGGLLPIGGVQVITDANGHACVNNLVLSSFVGTYTVTETLPGGYHSVGPLSQGVAVNNEAAGCGDEPAPDADVVFHNMPLTNIVITVDSQIDGGTASVINCDGTISGTDPNGDGGQTHNNLEPGIYTCTVVVDP